ncbi:Methyltransferase domain-containing protein [Tistlia consotensis]|uniref:Methyltransferase domain-containing protein n=1 Tax=Tistlia consotensis USBA 355 TaxID=560819 RepID=A0A1Y6CGT8_9PROT|nr:class I SAM-dependent methyltransferase [Tistlia consotensis]SMF63162.1 Methyltransferase domain-containing protein [Tistlia consotensis USBA 355]SNR95673.1 Methyltransferase domain-containing protein [Tistlia consotensis]
MTSESFKRRVYDSYLSSADGGRTDRSAADRAAVIGPRAAYLQRLVRRHFPADREARILDLGCGAGALLAVARQAGYRNLAGVDHSAEQVALAERLGIAGVRRGDLAESLAAAAPGALDLVVLFDVLEHFPLDQGLALLEQAARALAPGGRIVIHVPNAEALFGARIRYDDLTHETAFTPRSIAQLLSLAGFARSAVFEDRPAVHGLKSALRALVWRLVRGALRLALAAETGDSGRQAVFSQNLLAVADKARAAR